MYMYMYIRKQTRSPTAGLGNQVANPPRAFLEIPADIFLKGHYNRLYKQSIYKFICRNPVNKAVMYVSIHICICIYIYVFMNIHPNLCYELDLQLLSNMS